MPLVSLVPCIMLYFAMYNIFLEYRPVLPFKLSLQKFQKSTRQFDSVVDLFENLMVAQK